MRRVNFYASFELYIEWISKLKKNTFESLLPPLLALWRPLWLDGVMTPVAFQVGGQLCQWTQYTSNQTNVHSSYINTELAVHRIREQVMCNTKHEDLLLKC